MTFLGLKLSVSLLLFWWFIHILCLFCVSQKKQNTKHFFKSLAHKITILIPVHNEEKVLQKLIQNLKSLQTFSQLQIIFINDGSTDRTKEILNQECCANINVHHLNENRGKAAALQKGFELAEHELVLTTDADCLLSDENIIHLEKALLSHPQAQAASCAIGLENADNLLLKLQVLEYEILRVLKKMAHAHDQAFIMSGCATLYKKESVKQVGGIHHYCLAEDADLGFRLHAQGKTIYVDTTTVKTQAPNTIKSWFKQRRRWSRGIIQALRMNMKQVFSSGRSFSLQIHFFLTWLNFFFVTIPLLALLFFGTELLIPFILIQALTFLSQKAIRKSFHWKLIVCFALLPFYFAFLASLSLTMFLKELFLLKNDKHDVHIWTTQRY